jgi:dihydropyrimidine dehydrogenase (NAD+) subunit PreT
MILKKMTGKKISGFILNEAERCLLCYDPPCSKNCPAGTDPGTFIRKLRLKNIKGACETIMRNNIMGGTCGSVCPDEQLCKKDCCAGKIGRPIEIGKIQQALIEYAYEIGFMPGNDKVANKNKKIAVIGAGPAGLSCAYELAKNGYAVTVFEKRRTPGGLAEHILPDERLKHKLLDKDLGNLSSYNIKIKTGSPVENEKDINKLFSDGFSSVFISWGIWHTDKIIDSNASNIFNFFDFLEKAKKESSNLNKQVTGKAVAVIGGGSSAVDCAVTAKKMNAGDVYLIYRRTFNEMPAHRKEILDAIAGGINILLLTQPCDYLTDNKGNISGIKLRKNYLINEKGRDGRRKIKTLKDSDYLMNIDIIIESSGQTNDMEIMTRFPSLQFNKDGFIRTDRNYATSIEGVFAGGDASDGPALIVNAVASGKNAAEKIMKFIEKGGKEK